MADLQQSTWLWIVWRWKQQTWKINVLNLCKIYMLPSTDLLAISTFFFCLWLSPEAPIAFCNVCFIFNAPECILRPNSYINSQFKFQSTNIVHTVSAQLRDWETLQQSHSFSQTDGGGIYEVRSVGTGWVKICCMTMQAPKKSDSQKSVVWGDQGRTRYALTSIHEVQRAQLCPILLIIVQSGCSRERKNSSRMKAEHTKIWLNKNTSSTHIKASCIKKASRLRK